MDRKTLELYAALRASVAIGEARIKANPIPHLEAAAAEILRLRKVIRDADTAAKRVMPSMWEKGAEVVEPTPINEIRVLQEDWDRLQRCHDIVAAENKGPSDA